MTPEDRALAVLLRKAQWVLDDAAHAIPTGDFTVEQHGELADMLDQLAQAVRDRRLRCVVIDVPPTEQG